MGADLNRIARVGSTAKDLNTTKELIQTWIRLYA